MLLTVDIGNTNVVLGVFKEHLLCNWWRLNSHAHRSEDEWHIVLQSLLSNANLDVKEIKGIAISSVVPSVTPLFTSNFKKAADIKIIEITNDLDIGIVNRYNDPTSVGADRLCNAVAGLELYGGPLIIIDFGTATTFDVVSGNREYLGGIISPGLETAAQYLHKTAAKLPSVELRFPEAIIAKSTEQSIQAGIMFGALSSIEGIVSRIESELGQKTLVIATGGLGNLMIEKTSIIKSFEPNLTLIGIEKIYSRLAN